MIEGIPMSDNPEVKQPLDLIHVHRCTGCGTRTHRSRLNSADNHVGLYECPHLSSSR